MNYDKMNLARFFVFLTPSRVAHFRHMHDDSKLILNFNRFIRWHLEIICKMCCFPSRKHMFHWCLLMFSCRASMYPLTFTWYVMWTSEYMLKFIRQFPQRRTAKKMRWGLKKSMKKFCWKHIFWKNFWKNFWKKF